MKSNSRSQVTAGAARQYLVFGFLGPLVDLAVLLGVLYALSDRSDLRMSATEFANALVIAYLLGLPPALAAAKLVKRVSKRPLLIEALYVAAIGVLVGVGFTAVVTVPIFVAFLGVTLPNILDPYFLIAVFFSILSNLFDTVICWIVVRLLILFEARGS
jgi:hypothetical protein